MKLVGDKIYHDVKASSFTFLTERTCSEPVEDTDTTSFVAEFVSIFTLFFPPFVFVYPSLCLDFTSTQYVCDDHLFFKVESYNNLQRNVI